MGTLWAWGLNSGRLGLGGDTANKSTPTQIGSATDWAYVAYGDSHGAAIKSAGTLYTWGLNPYGALGQGDTSPRTTPTQVGSSTWLHVACGGYHTVAIRSDGTLWAWGYNTYGQLGLGDTSHRNSPTQVGSASNWVAVFTGVNTTFAINTSGELYSCGINGDNQLGRSGSTSSLLQVGSATDWLWVDGGTNHTLAAKRGGTLWAWGSGATYCLGQGSTSNLATPTQIGSATTWSYLSAGADLSVGVRVDGTLYQWGDSSIATPTLLSGGSDFLKAWVGAFNYYDNVAFGIKRTGTLWAWNVHDNGYSPQPNGELGLGDTATHLAPPTQVGSATDWKRVTGLANAIVGIRGASAAEPGFILSVSVPSSLVLGERTGAVSVPASLVLDAGLGTVSVPASLTIEDRSGPVGVPASLTLAPITGAVSVPASLVLETVGALSVPARLSLLPGYATRVFSARVVLDGEDISTRVAGRIEVDAEEGAARIAQFAMLPAAGPIDPIAWTGSTVMIDLIRVVSGVSVASRLFTGLVDLATYDPIGRIVEFDCTDDLQNKVAALTRAQIDALTGAEYNVAVHGDIDDNWDYAMALMAARPASLDAGPLGGLRVTEWHGLDVWATIDGDDALSDSPPSLLLPKRRELVNRVDVVMEYRYSRLRERHVWLGWSKSLLDTDAYASGYQLPAWSAIESALSGTGWRLLTSTYLSGPRYVAIGYDDGFWKLDSGLDGGITNWTAHLAQRHSQTVTERYAMTVTAPDSIAANGTVAVSLRGALASAWNAEAWESDFTIAPDASAGHLDYAPDTPRAQADAALEILLAQASTRILASHRKSPLTWMLTCMPEIDLNVAAAFEYAADSNLSGSGKVARVRHLIDTDIGEASTEVTIAISGVKAGGLTEPSAMTAPEAPAAESVLDDDDWMGAMPALLNHLGAVDGAVYSDALMGWLCNAPPTFSLAHYTAGEIDATTTIPNPYYSEADAWEVTGFRISLPGVADAWRNPLDIPIAASYDVAIPVDPLSLE